MSIVKTIVNLPSDAITAIEKIAEDRGSTMSDVIRRAISTEKFIHEERQKGNKILIEDKWGNLKIVVWP